MRKSNILVLVLLVVALAAVAGRLPVERTTAEFPELHDNWDYRIVRVSEDPSSVVVRVSHSSHARMTEDERAERARSVASVVAARRPAAAGPIVIELAWTWHSDLLTKFGSSRYAFARGELD